MPTFPVTLHLPLAFEQPLVYQSRGFSGSTCSHEVDIELDVELEEIDPDSLSPAFAIHGPGRRIETIFAAPDDSLWRKLGKGTGLEGICRALFGGPPKYQCTHGSPWRTAGGSERKVRGSRDVVLEAYAAHDPKVAKLDRDIASAVAKLRQTVRLSGGRILQSANPPYYRADQPPGTNSPANIDVAHLPPSARFDECSASWYFGAAHYEQMLRLYPQSTPKRRIEVLDPTRPIRDPLAERRESALARALQQMLQAEAAIFADTDDDATRARQVADLTRHFEKALLERFATSNHDRLKVRRWLRRAIAEPAAPSPPES